MNNRLKFFKSLLVLPVALAISVFSSAISQELLDDYYYVVIPWERVDVEGDRDGFGLGLAEGDTLAVGSSIFDEREFDDPYFTDVAPIPWTDPGSHSFSYTHIFDPPEWPVEARLRFLTLGIQDGDSQVSTSDTDIRLYVDGLEIPGAFDDVDQFDRDEQQGWVELAGYVEIPIPEDLGHVLEDGVVEVTYEVLQLGSHTGTDSFAIDFSELVLAIPYHVRIDLLSDIIAVLDLNTGTKRLLTSSLLGASRLLSDANPDNDVAAANMLSAFLNKIEALRGKKIDEVLADYLTGTVKDMIAALEGESACPCWSYSDIYSLPMAGTVAACDTDSEFRMDIFQVGICEHSYGVAIGPDGGLSCVANRFSCPGLPDLGGDFMDASEAEFANCLTQIVDRCEELGIEAPDFP